MKTKKNYGVLAATLIIYGSLAAIPMAQGAQIIFLIGDVDTFGTNRSLPDGYVGSGTIEDFSDFTASFVHESEDPDQTDSLSSVTTFTTIDLSTILVPGSVLSATLDFRTYAMGDGGRGPHDVLINGVVIGNTPAITSGTTGQQQVLATQSYSVPVNILNYGDTTQSFGLVINGGDGFYVDYARLTVETVPEPSSAALIFGTGVIGVALRRRRKPRL